MKQEKPMLELNSGLF